MQPNQFQLEAQRATLVHLNPRAEKHGDENEPAADQGEYIGTRRAIVRAAAAIAQQGEQN